MALSMAHLPILHLTTRHPSAILLLTQLTGMLLYPFLEGTQAGLVAFNVFGVTILTLTTHNLD
jgi:hypothetical protein